MAAPQSVHDFLQQFRSRGTTIVNEQPKFDLELYLQNYSGRSRFDRLIVIATSCVPLCADALLAAVNEAKAGHDIQRYMKACQYLQSVLPNDPAAELDEKWTQNMELENRLETDRLEKELKGYKNNLIKETIRMGHEDLGKHYESTGDLPKAMDGFMRMLKDVSTTKQIADCCLHIARVAMQQGDWQSVLTNSAKISASHGSSPPEESAMQVKGNILAGIGYMSLGQYAEAAKSFLQVNFVLSASQYSELVSPSDVAVYGGLTALATMDRGELQQRVMGNTSFRSFLEHEVHVRKAINFFINGRYPSCLSILESVRPDLLLDMYLQDHVKHLYSKIRSKCIEQYLIPYHNVTMRSLQAAFGRPNHDMETELVDMILQKSLKARINTKEKLLVAECRDARHQMQTEALETAQEYEAEAKERLRRINLIAAGLEVGGDQADHSFDSTGGLMGKPWQDHNIFLDAATADPAIAQTAAEY